VARHAQLIAVRRLSDVIAIRSLLFNTAFYLNLVAWLLVVWPTLLMPRRAIIAVAKAWGRFNLLLLRVICGTTVEWRGREKLPPGPLLVAAKHQSLWETFALFPLFDDPTFILKRELMWLPLFGWLMRKAGMISVDRAAGKDALATMIADYRAALAQGRQVVIFPEGTRRAPGAEPDYKLGIVFLYAGGNVPCLPVALNSGLYWRRRGFLRYPGTIRVEFLDPIPPGLHRRIFFRRLQDEIETATAGLVEQAFGELGQPATQDLAAGATPAAPSAPRVPR
jgi:1-acyl-sn-glycerol-3-phosphate acyltransferase